MSFFYWKWDNAISKEFCELILQNTDWNKEISARVVSAAGEEENVIQRKTNIVWEDRLSVIGCIADKYIRSANINAGWNFDITDTENIQIGKYENNGFYDWHTDVSIEKMEDSPRKLSFSLLLNDPKEFENGNLEFKKFDDQPIIEQGTIIVFPSIMEHRVTPVTKGVRYSAVTWMHGAKFK